MTTGSTASGVEAETKRVRRLQDKVARHYDRRVRFWERVLFGGGREWVCSRARGDVLELAVGTARNLAHYPVAGVRLTGVELSPEMLAIARQRARKLGRSIDLHLGDVQALESPIRASTPWSALLACARSPMRVAP